METDDWSDIDKERGITWTIQQQNLKKVLIDPDHQIVIRDYVDVIRNKPSRTVSAEDYERYWNNYFPSKEIDNRVLLIL